MERTQVTSTNIQAIGYDADSQTLEVEFKSGPVYQYTGVPQGEYDAIMAAGSKGTFLHTNIKDRYPFTKL
tara:strand:- start:21396 stop:21605 length:210 start_codon:yes stop_codon:yes gene_type:complete